MIDRSRIFGTAFSFSKSCLPRDRPAHHAPRNAVIIKDPESAGQVAWCSLPAENLLAGGIPEFQLLPHIHADGQTELVEPGPQ